MERERSPDIAHRVTPESSFGRIEKILSTIAASASRRSFVATFGTAHAFNRWQHITLAAQPIGIGGRSE
jgi:hypothetical protein